MRLTSLDQIFEALLGRFPRPIADFLWNVSVIFGWVAVPASALSMLVDIELVTRWWDWLRLQDDIVKALIDTAAPLVRGAVGVWRDFTAPFREFVDWLLPISLPPQFADFALIALGCGPSMLRYASQRRRTETAHDGEYASMQNLTHAQAKALDGGAEQEDLIKDVLPLLHERAARSAKETKREQHRLRQAAALLLTAIVLSIIVAVLVVGDWWLRRGE